MPSTAVGIDAVEIWSGNLRLDLPETFAPQKGDDPEKYTKGLGLQASSFPDAYEDIVTMGANAAKRLMDRKGLTPNDIGRIDVATESSFDNSKPISTYIAGCLEQVYDEDFHHANKGERKFACLAGTQALDDACNWIRAGRNRGRAALVIATDTALYARGDAGEATQGAGSVAILVDEEPALVALSAAQGYGSADETDFLKPNQQFPTVDGKRSMQVYLARMREALEDYEGVAGETHPDDISLAPFHTPFPGMVRKAALLGYRHTVRDTEVEDELADSIGRQPRLDEFETRDDFEDAVREYTDDLKETAEYQDWYDATVRPTLEFSRRVGNWYTGSVHLTRISGLWHAAKSDIELTGDTLLVGSYGSGAQAEVHAETVQPGWSEEMDAINFHEQVDSRYDLSWEEYERVHAAHTHGSDATVEEYTRPSGEFVFDGHGRMGERKYDFIPE